MGSLIWPSSLSPEGKGGLISRRNEHIIGAKSNERRGLPHCELQVGGSSVIIMTDVMIGTLKGRNL